MEAVCFGAVDRPQSRRKVWSNVLLAFTRYGLVGSTDRLIAYLCFAAWGVGKGNYSQKNVSTDQDTLIRLYSMLLYIFILTLFDGTNTSCLRLPGRRQCGCNSSMRLQERRTAPNMMTVRKTVGRANVVNFPCALKQNNSFCFPVASLRVRQFFEATLPARMSRNFDRVGVWSVANRRAFHRALKGQWWIAEDRTTILPDRVMAKAVYKGVWQRFQRRAREGDGNRNGETDMINLEMLLKLALPFGEASKEVGCELIFHGNSL